jgi:3-oxoacyl-[acyl-carrier protein] reductase
MAWQIDLSKETAIVTGGSRNIGLAIALGLRAAGARVCIWGGHDAKALNTAVDQLGGASDEVMGLLVPVEREGKVIEAFDAVESRLGTVSILINNAAARPHEALADMSLAAWQSVLDVILTGAFLSSRELFRRLPADRRAAIVNIGGLSAHRPVAERVHVITAKAGLVGLTRALAEEGLGRIRANCVVPGAILGDRRQTQRHPSHLDDARRSAGSVDDVARCVLPLADPQQYYVTGQTLHVSGGRFTP